jgi:hypothetical protein
MIADSGAYPSYIKVELVTSEKYDKIVINTITGRSTAYKTKNSNYFDNGEATFNTNF